MKHKYIIIGLSVVLIVLIVIQVHKENNVTTVYPRTDITNTKTESVFNSAIDIRDLPSTDAGENNTIKTTTPVVPDYLKGEDSIAYIENAIYKSPITSNDLLGLAEVHSLEDMFFNYNNLEKAKDYPEESENYLATKRDTAAMRLANRFMRMLHLANLNGDAKDKQQWVVAVNTLIDNYHKTMPAFPKDSILNEIVRVTSKFSSMTQFEMNYQCYILAALEDYYTLEAYRQWLLSVPNNLKLLAEEEYEAWLNLNDARFAFWGDVSYTQEWYSMKPMELEGYYQNMLKNRHEELKIERDIILNGMPYKQKGTTVRTKEWEQWIADNSVPEDYDSLMELDMQSYIPSDSIVTERVNSLKSSFSRWLKVRQAIAAELPEEQGKSYDNLTADIHSRIIGKLPLIVPLHEY